MVGGKEGASWYNHVRLLRDLRVEVSRGLAKVERTPQRILTAKGDTGDPHGSVGLSTQQDTQPCNKSEVLI